MVAVGMWRYNPDLATVDIGDHDLACIKKYRNVNANAQAVLVVDDLTPVDPGFPVASSSKEPHRPFTKTTERASNPDCARQDCLMGMSQGVQRPDTQHNDTTWCEELSWLTSSCSTQRSVSDPQRISSLTHSATTATRSTPRSLRRRNVQPARCGCSGAKQNRHPGAAGKSSQCHARSS